jgi:hypothetical protein
VRAVPREREAMRHAEPIDIRWDVELHTAGAVAERVEVPVRELAHWSRGLSPVPWWVRVGDDGLCFASEDR